MFRLPLVFALLFVVPLLLLTPVAAAADGPLAWWRFEDVAAHGQLAARMGRGRSGVTVDSSGHDHPLRTFNTDPTRYPPDTSPEFQADVGPTTVTGGVRNDRSVRFTGKQYLFTTDDRVDAPLYADRSAAAPFTVEGLFKLETIPDDYDGRPQVILCKAQSPVADPIQLAVETAPPLTTRPATTAPATRPATTRSTTHPSTTHPSTTHPSTTHPSTTQATRPAFEGPTERVNDHPVQPIACYVQGTNAWPEPAAAPADHFVAALVDAAGRQHVVWSDAPLVAHRWYAFAVSFDGRRVTLRLSDPGTGTYHAQQRTTGLRGGLYPCRGSWMVGCGLIDDVREDWFQGWVDEVRISDGVVPDDKLVAAGSRFAPAPVETSHGNGSPPPASVIHGLADPDVLLDGGVYYCYGTRDQVGFPVYTSTDLLHWDRGPDVLRRRPGMWAVNRYWAPSPIKYRGKYYLFYGALGHIAASGGRWSHRINVGVSDSPLGPFEPHAGPLPLIGKAVIDPAAFVDTDGKVYLYFVADMSENEVSQIFVAQLNDELTGIVGEPVLCLQPSQVWEGKLWNEGPSVFKRDGVYVMTYSADFWHSPAYGVGFATSRTPTGPWTKNPANPILQRWRGLYGTGGDCVVPMPNGSKDMAILFHADGPPGSKRRDTYVDKLVVTPDPRLGVMLKPEAWSPPTVR